MTQATVTIGDRRSIAGNARAWKQRRLAAAVAGVALFPLINRVDAITIRDDTSDSQYTSLSAESQYASSGYVDVYTGESPFPYNFLSATLIAPDWVLTAAHGVTVNETGPAYPASDITFGQGSDFSLPGPDSVSQVLVESGYDGDFYVGDDLALLQLSTPITTVAPTPLYYSGLGSLRGQTATVIGYGYTGTGLTGYSTANVGTRRGMQDIIYAFGGGIVVGGTTGDPTENSLEQFSSNILFTQFEAPETAMQQSTNTMGGLNAVPLALAGATAPGDSGGGVFVTVAGKPTSPASPASATTSTRSP
jgi:V8-like Glu-specific endopeptidase